MSALGPLERRLTEPAGARLLAAVEPLTRTKVGAGAVRVGIHYEAQLRDHRRRYVAAWSLLSGRRTQHQRWEIAERQARAQLAPSRPVAGSHAPVVFWHGPDRVASDGRPLVVLINGWTASGLLWPKELVTQLEERGDVVRIDNRGSGYSRTAPAPFTVGRLADDVADVLAAIGAGSATLVGLSMGGMIAQEVAVRHPHLVERLVLCATRPPTPVGFLPPPAVLEHMMSTALPGETLQQHLQRTWGSVVGPGFAVRHPEVIRELVDQICARPTPRPAVITQLRAMSGWHGAERMKRITAPTTVIHGRDDVLMPVGNGMRLSQLIPNAEYVELTGVGHLVPYEAPEVLSSAVLQR